MRRCFLLLCLLVGSGCATDANRSEWDGALRDLRGDNMKMQSSEWGSDKTLSQRTMAP